MFTQRWLNVGLASETVEQPELGERFLFAAMVLTTGTRNPLLDLHSQKRHDSFYDAGRFHFSCPCGSNPMIHPLVAYLGEFVNIST